ncbi:hypothetical protein [Burkholderia glumae]|uniref:hypothetical protein n=1 Tax=Burkholderia glumae TaxID=337 RepID=UPI002151D918|nr:hypothetical protein [Burkholderia glumae]
MSVRQEMRTAYVGEVPGMPAGRMTKDEMRIDVLSGRIHAQEALLKALMDVCVDEDLLLRRLDAETANMSMSLRESDCSLLMYAAFIEHTASLRDYVAAPVVGECLRGS